MKTPCRIQLSLLIGLLAVQCMLAQTPSDGIAMPRGELCMALNYQQDSWKEYWENTLKRDNPNLGTVSNRSVSFMAALGLTEHVNVIASLPYVFTKASAGVLHGYDGIQDLGLFVKVRPWSHTLGKGTLISYATAGVSTPASRYYPDFLPLSIGLGSTVASLQGILHYETQSGLYATGQAGYFNRSNVTLDRDHYYNEEGAFYTDQVDMPDVMTASVLAGFLNDTWRVEASWNLMNTLGGTQIRRNEMPFPSNEMDMQRVGLMFQYHLPFLKGLRFTANGSYVIRGKNVGQSTGLGAGFLYQFAAWTPRLKSN